MRSSSTATAMHREFGSILRLYDESLGQAGAFYEVDSDFPKFLGHEMYLCVIASLLMEDELEAVDEMLSWMIYVPQARDSSQPATFDRVSEYVKTLEIGNAKQSPRRASPHAELFKSRHSTGRLAELIPFVDLVGAEYLLYLRSSAWRPWTAIYLQHAPRYLVESISKRYADRLCKLVGVGNVTELAAVIAKRNEGLGSFFRGAMWFGPFKDFDLARLGQMT